MKANREAFFGYGQNTPTRAGVHAPPHFILYGNENHLVGQPLENKEISSAMKFPTTRSPWSLYIGTGHVCDYAGMRIHIE
ncbi:hypothetical protein [Paraburkholderia dilworthii]|uniref:hypothetical protein n=1 Tax=Paraburkholderia dilworthii TaxID=948106 RepID=UPI0004046202|nr:hypothetical protein [Paraburkholderia dilworthii]